MHNTTECQQKLIELGYLPAVNPVTGKRSDDGVFGAISLGAYNRYRKVALHAVAVMPPVHLDALNADLFPEEQPPAAAPKPSLFDQIGAIASIVKTLKGLSSMTNTTTSSSATVDVKSAWLSKLNWTMAVGLVFNVFMLFGHPVPADVQTQVYAVGNGAIFVIGWAIKTFFTKTITPSSAKSL